MRIRLNGEPFDLDSARTVSQLLIDLEIDARRVAVEHNLSVLKRHTFDTTTIQEGDEIEIVNFVGGGTQVLRVLGAKVLGAGSSNLKPPTSDLN